MLCCCLQVFREGEKLYGFKGLAGRLAPIGVHAAMLLVMVGGTYSALGGFQGSAMIPQGLQVLVSDTLVGNSFAARPTSNMNMVLQLDRFYIDYRPNGEVLPSFYNGCFLQCLSVQCHCNAYVTIALVAFEASAGEAVDFDQEGNTMYMILLLLCLYMLLLFSLFLGGSAGEAVLFRSDPSGLRGAGD